MRFPLSFDGALPSSGNPRRSGDVPKLEQIWHIRNVICPQIKAIYDTHPAFNQRHGHGRALIQAVNQPIVVDGKEFYPLARVAFRLKCELEIALLVNHPIASIVTSGISDLDNRLKTLFDALRVPTGAQEIKSYMPNIEPYCCLLENDVLISALHVETFRNVAAPAGASLDHVRLNITVRLTAIEWDFLNEPFQHD